VGRLVYLFLVFIGGVSFLEGCVTTQEATNGPGVAAKVRSWISSLKDLIAGEQTFSAADGNYFPPAILLAFPKAAEFSRANPTVKLARSGIKIIETRPLSQSSAKSQNEANLSWSHDGNYLGFEITTFNQRKILLADLGGNYHKELSVMGNRKDNFLDGMVAAQTHSYNSGLRWASRGRRFTFMSNGGNGTYNIYVGTVGGREQAITSGSAKDGYASWNPATSEIAFVSSRSGNGDIYVVDSSSKATQRLSDSPAVDIFPEWSPDGNALAYSSGDSLRHEIIMVKRSENGRWNRPTPLTSWNRDSLRPTFSPDGRLIAFYSEAGPSGDGSNVLWNLHVIDLNAKKIDDLRLSTETIVARDVVVDLNTGPAWTPDGRRILYIKRSPDSFNPICVYDLYSGENLTLSTGTKMNRDLMMSRVGVLSFRAQEGAWDRVYLTLTNLGDQLQNRENVVSRIHYLQ
jgi:Tol biopolymer transport system component